METNEPKAFEAWGLLELFGHQRIAGLITEQTIGGVHFLRIDVPALPAGANSWEKPIQAYTRYFTQGAIYGMTPTSEEVARRLAADMRARPAFAVSLESRPALSSASLDDDDLPG